MQIVVALHAGELRPAIRLRRNLHVVELVGVCLLVFKTRVTVYTIKQEDL